MPPLRPKIDKRLLGTWRSDREATVSEWRFRKRLTPKLRRIFLRLFGHLQLIYTPTRVRGVLRGYVFAQRYELLAADADSVAIRFQDAQLKADARLNAEWSILHIHFEGRDRYWISVGANREWFRKVNQRATVTRRHLGRSTASDR